MRDAHTVEQVRAAEAALMARLPEGALMQQAATGLSTAVADLLGRVYGARVLLLVGSGDNGGDALWAGARLARRGAAVSARLLSPDKTHPAGLAALRAAGGRVVEDDVAALATRPDLAVDGIVGIGGRGGLRPDAAALVAALADADVPVVAVDVPSGVDVDTGRLDGPHVEALATVTFGTHKVAHLVDPAARAAGTVHVVDLGLDLPRADVTALQADDVAALLPVPEPAAHKYTRGLVGVRAGSEQYPGAAVLCVAGAGTGFAGMVRYVGAAADEVRAAHPEVVVGVGQVQAWVVGSGGGDDAAEAVREAAADGVPLVLDADALQHLDAAGSGERLLTPHAGELARLLGVEREEVETDQLGFARRAAEETGAVVLLKGRHTLVAAPDGRVRATTVGPPWLATAGAGDVLAGLCGSLLAAGLDAFDAGSVGSWLHGAAAAHASGGGPIRARDVAAALPTVCRALLG
ncbi:NAD(P)H-hydrate dehydratase [Nocardioides iriomotensis]|uniref:Bifunctional NAD(P)H-hydrate repair enzyme n=1 Tax=Nocardioides iriomotensis TaxID=715784 RepID=A0A4Q5JCD3_9ACTN|nr:NAD(P)H-hydrate dehydratase [Nocardioides iriomotensis]RYU15691.1 NAD(P)H-hydrate dehydratase [Nocardioides iriomotensis]